MTKVSNTFCVVPWIGAVIAPNRENLICCRANETVTEYTLDSVNTKTHQHLRDALGKGIKDPICNRCWSDEKAGIESYRENYNRTYKDLIASDAYDPPKLRFLELTPSNVCNLACRMCTSKYSSKIVARERYLSEIDLFDITEKSKFTSWRDLDLTNLEEIKLMGGEPMYLKDHLNLLNYLDDLDILKNISLMLITNCTQKFTDEWKRLLTKAKTTHIAMSIDGVGSINDYIRQYSDWSNIEKNLKEIFEINSEFKNISISVNCTVSLYNVNKTKELEEYMQKNNVHCYFNPLTYPKYQSLHYISESNKKYFLQHPGVTDKVKHVFRETTENIVSYDEFIKQTSAVDEFYSKFLKDYNFEIYNIFYKNSNQNNST